MYKKFVPFLFGALILSRSQWRKSQKSLLYKSAQGSTASISCIYCNQMRCIRRSICTRSTRPLWEGMILRSCSRWLCSCSKKGARSPDTEEQLTSLYGSAIAGVATAIDILEAGILSPHPETQMAAIQYLGSIQDDRSEELLTKAMSSDFFYTRMQAAYQLAMRKARNAVGQIESLMHKVPPPLRFFFPQFFALIGTKDAIALLRHMMDDQFHMTRIEAILNAARFGRDDLLPLIRARATHLNSAEQEACASAIGMLRDLKSLKLLHQLSSASVDTVSMAAKRALLAMGDESGAQGLIDFAKEGNLFAIALLGEVPGAQDILFTLAKSPNIQIRFNAAFSLLQLKDPRSIDPILEFLIRDSRDLGFQPVYSTGNSMLSWKVIPSAPQHQKKDALYDLMTISLNVREIILRSSLELKEEDFLQVARAVFDSKQAELIPLLIHLLENLGTPDVIAFLQKKAQTAGAPLIRAYCHLALFRLKQGEEHRDAILSWIHVKKNTELIRFRPMLPWDVKLSEKATLSISPLRKTPTFSSRHTKHLPSPTMRRALHTPPRWLEGRAPEKPAGSRWIVNSVYSIIAPMRFLLTTPLALSCLFCFTGSIYADVPESFEWSKEEEEAWSKEEEREWEEGEPSVEELDDEAYTDDVEVDPPLDEYIPPPPPTPPLTLPEELMIDLKNPSFSQGIISTEEGGVISGQGLRIQGKKIQYINRLENGIRVQRIIAEGDLMLEYANRAFVGSKLDYDFTSQTGHSGMARRSSISGSSEEIGSSCNRTVLFTSAMPT